VGSDAHIVHDLADSGHVVELGVPNEPNPTATGIGRSEPHRRLFLPNATATAAATTAAAFRRELFLEGCKLRGELVFDRKLLL
jgi:hypothetical protein